MENLGKITEWRDERGFGFITPLQDGETRVFFHIRDYRQAGRRPELGELVKYVAKADGGRWKAASVSRAIHRTKTATAGSARQAAPRRIPASIQYTLVAVYIGGLAWAIGDDRLPVEFLFAVLASSAIAYSAYAFDKRAAETGRQRIPEATLHLMELLCGWPGALLAQLRLRHKTSKRSYRVEFWLIAIANVAATFLWIARP